MKINLPYEIPSNTPTRAIETPLGTLFFDKNKKRVQEWEMENGEKFVFFTEHGYYGEDALIKICCPDRKWRYFNLHTGKVIFWEMEGGKKFGSFSESFHGRFGIEIRCPNKELCFFNKKTKKAVRWREKNGNFFSCFYFLCEKTIDIGKGISAAKINFEGRTGIYFDMRTHREIF